MALRNGYASRILFPDFVLTSPDESASDRQWLDFGTLMAMSMLSKHLHQDDWTRMGEAYRRIWEG